MAKNKIASLIIAGVAILFLGYVLSQTYSYVEVKIKNSKIVDAATNASIAEWEKSPEQKLKPFDVFHLDVNTANERPHLTLVIDPLCSDCGTLFQKLFLLRTKEKLSFSVYFYALDSHCNPFIHYRSDGLSCQLTRSIMCAETTAKKGIQLTSLLFEQNKNLVTNLAQGPQILDQQLDQLNLNKTQISDCAKSDQAMKQNAESIASVSNLKFTRLPVLIYKNKIYNAGLLEKGIEQLLETNP